jgi:tetratricopeptide (TPR) repeat protein
MRLWLLRSPGRIFRLAALAGALVVMPRAARAEASASEKKLFKEMMSEARADEKAGKCAEAIEVLRQVLQIRETGDALLQLGECLAKTGKLAEALKTWEHAEDVARGDKDKATQQALLPKLAAVRARMPAVALQIAPDVTAAKITIDGQAVELARASVPIALDPGEHTIAATAPERAAFSTRVTLAEKESKVVVVALPSLTARPVEAPVKKGGVPLGTWIAGGVGVALAVGGVVAFASAGSAASDGAADCAKKASCDPAAAKTVRKLDAAALGLWIGAGVSVGAGVTLLVLDHGPARSAAGAAARLRPAPRAMTRLVVAPSSIGLEGTF